MQATEGDPKSFVAAVQKLSGVPAKRFGEKRPLGDKKISDKNPTPICDVVIIDLLSAKQIQPSHGS